MVALLSFHFVQKMNDKIDCSQEIASFVLAVFRLSCIATEVAVSVFGIVSVFLYVNFFSVQFLSITSVGIQLT